jgi:hypothetical protein
MHRPPPRAEFNMRSAGKERMQWPGRRTKKRIGSERAAPHVRQFLGQRVRALRKERSLSQGRLAAAAERIFALVSAKHPRPKIRRAYEMLFSSVGWPR